MTTALDKARAAADAATAKLAEAEAAEAEKAARLAVERTEQQLELDSQFLANWRSLDAELRTPVSRDAKADAVLSGTLPALLADYLGRRDASQSLRNHAQNCAARLGEDSSGITDLRYVDPVDELRRWQDDALLELKHRTANTLSGEILARYKVA